MTLFMNGLVRVFPALKFVWRPPEYYFFVPPKPYLIGSCGFMSDVKMTGCAL